MMDALDNPAALPDSGFADARELLAIIASPERHAALIGELRARIAAAEEGAAALTGGRETFDAAVREQTAALNLESDGLADRHVAIIEKRKTLAPRRDAIFKLHSAWQNLGETENVFRGLQNPQHGDAVTKALRGYNKLPAPPLEQAEDHGFDRPAHWLPPPMASHDSPRSVRPPATRTERRRARHRGIL